ncbi:hypothetical protein COU18_00925 [Candidatus Kaiserbacteria bacterium CG10_big_fil_rev_8_21_14_0_10_51_14]|uniref:Uncharacterized protein n=1 Tax=Candidatus Kaiserbacteria bacterium CG10_big_fil_rev_8_21_14_0_10_51_14 TaxID=1974610 RepID=A0A2H0UC79_9BACT|nr:MAG: hypothetical protein COU18_00925 [Candidatus Kaiserbacteria bacterium CG10_big_fil_rev_8_21_14_0_10_51_14]
MRHLLLRKRVTKTLEPYPARTIWKRVLDKLVYTVGIIGPLMTLPQIILIYAGQDASGVSPLTWFGWALLDIPWIVYGLVHREWPIVTTYSLWLSMNLIVAIGAVMYA